MQSAAYITGEKLHEERRGITANYSNRGDVSYAGTLAPEWAGNEFRNTEKAWNAFEKHADEFAERYYKTKETQDKFKASAQTGMKVILAFPKELSAEVHKEILHDFMEKSFISKGHVVTFGIHTEEGNPHAHLQVSHWTIEKDGTISIFKNRDLYSRIGLKLQRETWANTVNHYLEREGLDVRIDHRSYKDQGLDLIPTIHEGWYAKSLIEKGLPSRLVEENKAIREENQQRISEYPEIIFKELTAQRATYSELDVLKVVQNRTLDHPQLAQHVFEAVIDKSIHIGHGFDRQRRFTSPEYHKLENELLANFDKLSGSFCIRKIAPLAIDSEINYRRSQGVKISEEQEQAIKVLCADSNFSVLVGRAGTGKTTSVLAPVVALHQGAGFNVMGMALAAEAAKNLAEETGCQAETIAYYTYRWNEIPKLQVALNTSTLTAKERSKMELQLENYQKTLPTKDTVIIVDEAGMVGTHQWHDLTQMVEKTGAKLLICGDDHQYKAINAGDVLRKSIEIAEDKGCKAELTQIFRQNVPWMAKASIAFSQLETTTALMSYENNGHVRELATNLEMVSAIANHYIEKVKHQPEKSGCVLTSTNEIRLLLNKEIREQLQTNNLLESDVITHQDKGFALGEKIVFLDNDRGQWKVKSESGDFGVKNGTRGTIEAVKPVQQQLKFQDQDGQVTTTTVETFELTVRVNPNDRVKFTLHDYKAFDHAYAVTGYKAQGQTVDWSMVHLSKHLDAYGLYVMMTRHREDVTLYHNRQEIDSFSKFADNIRGGYKDLAVDYTIKPENYEAYFNVEDYKTLGREIMHLIKEKGDKAGLVPNQATSSTSEKHTFAAPSLGDLLKVRKELARLIVEERDEHKLFVMQAGLTFERLEMTAGLKAHPLTLIEQKAQVTVEQYGQVALEARELWHEIRKTAPGSLAKTHPDYGIFNELRQERGRLANMIVEATTLHRPFIKDVSESLGYGLATIQKQAIEFQSAQLQQTLKQDGLDHATSQKLNVLAAYVEARDQFGEIWKELRPQLKQAEGTLLKPMLEAQVHFMRQTSIERDKLAYHIVDRFEEYQPLAQSIQVSLDTSKLFTQSENGLRQICLEQYKTSNSQLAKSMAASELNQLWQGEKEAGVKATVRELLQNKINLLEIKAEAQKFERLQIQGSLTNDQDKQLFKDLSHYQNMKDTARDHYKLCLEEATEKGIKPWESGYYTSYATVNKQKDEVAFTLIKQSSTNVNSMAEKMSVSLKSLDQEAHRHDLRQTANIYLSGMGAQSALAAKELQAWLDFDRADGSKQTLGMLGESKILPRELMTHIQEKEAQFKGATSVIRGNQILDSKNLEAGSFKTDHPVNLHDSLKERIGELSHHLLGDPSSRSAYQYRYGRKGSIGVMVSGSNQGLYSNFETGVHGGPLKMIEDKLQLSSKEATGWAKEWLGQTLTPVQTPSLIPHSSSEKGKEKTWTPILPVPNHVTAPEIKANPYLSYMTKDRDVTALYLYKNQEGQTLGYVARLEDKEGFKITPTLTFCQNDKGQQYWKWQGFGENRPLYGLDRLQENKPVLIVEGEKAADAAQKLLPGHAVLSWPGGAGAVNKANWSPLIGREVIIWPDNDQAGLKAADKIATALGQLNQLQGAQSQVKIVDLPKDLPEKWDLADKLPENLSLDKVMSLIAPPMIVMEQNQQKTWKETLLIDRQEQLNQQIQTSTGKSLSDYQAARQEFMKGYEGKIPKDKISLPPTTSSQVQDFVKRFQEYETLVLQQEITPAKQEDFQKEVFEFSKNEKVSAHLKLYNSEMGQRIEKMAQEYENRQELKLNRGLDLSR